MIILNTHQDTYLLRLFNNKNSIVPITCVMENRTSLRNKIFTNSAYLPFSRFTTYIVFLNDGPLTAWKKCCNRQTSFPLFLFYFFFLSIIKLSIVHKNRNEEWTYYKKMYLGSSRDKPLEQKHSLCLLLQF